jgi:DNA-binding Lrp family transcriptional regulator
MDELDVKILRALISESAIGQSESMVQLSLRKMASRLRADDMTVRNRFRKLQEAGCMSRWRLLVNPAFFGYQILDVVLRVATESGKKDMIRKIRLIHGVFAIQNFHGNALKILMLYNGEESRSRAIELISRITNAERITASHMALPGTRLRRLSETDVALIEAFSNDARKSSIAVAKELGLSSRTVRNRVKKLRAENAVFALPNLNVDGILGFIPVYLSYTYSDEGAKGSVDRAMISRFDSNYLWGGFSDLSRGFIVLYAPTMADVQKFLDWARELPGVAGAEVDIMTELIYVRQTFKQFLAPRMLEAAYPAN